MDTDNDDKSIVGKTVDAVKELAATISEAAHKAVNPEPSKSNDEIMVLPPTPTGFLDDAVTPPVIIRRRTKRTKELKTPKRTNKSTNKSAKKSAKKAKSPQTLRKTKAEKPLRKTRAQKTKARAGKKKLKTSKR